MKFVSVVIPTYNRFDELIITLPQVIRLLDEHSELIIFDQSDSYHPTDYIDQLSEICSGANVSYYHCSVPSVTLAWNTAAQLAKGSLILFLDDDVNLDINILGAHREYYEKDPDIMGVAGGYYASSYDRTWVPSSRKGVATTLAGVNTSLRKEFFDRSGVASNFIRPFAGFDWELAEHINQHYGKVVVGERALVFHRAPASGGCGNQATRGPSWYYGCYHNHFLWMLHRKFPYSLTQLPRHFYSLVKYCLPKKETLLSLDYLKQSIILGIKDAYLSHKKSKGRVTEALALGKEVTCVLSCSKGPS